MSQLGHSTCYIPRLEAALSSIAETLLRARFEPTRRLSTSKLFVFLYNTAY